MKKTPLLLITLFYLLQFKTANSQASIDWTISMNTSPDSAALMPVKTLSDQNGNVFVLNFYRKYLPSSTLDKIYLHKFDYNGNNSWNLIFDNGGSGNSRALDLAVDDNGNCFIAGGIEVNQIYRPFIMKVSASGNILWQRDSTLSFSDGKFDQVIFQDNLIYLAGQPGIAVFDTNGNEQWSHPVGSERMLVDHAGRMVFLEYPSFNQKLHRYDISGNLDFSDSTILGERIAVDFQNNYYILAQYSNYELEKYDSNGVFQWLRNSFPLNLLFADLNFDVLTDYNNDVILIGLSDTMFKFNTDGNEIWRKPMNGLDNYIIDSKIAYTNFIAIGGTIVDTNGYDVMAALYDLNGNRTWYGTYDSNAQQEFCKSITIDNQGIYLLEDSISSSTLIKFDSPVYSSIDYSLVCVDSVWYEPANPGLINVRIFNGNVSHMNYPSVQIVSPTGDTISNKINFVNFFAHLGNEFQVYQDTITIAGITDFSGHTFVVHEGFGDSTAVIDWCSSVGINDIPENNLSLFPNPATNTINLLFQNSCLNCRIEIISDDGKNIMTKKLDVDNHYQLDVSNLSSGFYILRISNEKSIKHYRLIKQ